MVLIGAVACGGGGDSSGGATSGSSNGGVFIEPANADKAAHAAMLAPSDMPGNGWSVVSRDAFDDDGEGDDDFVAAMDGVRECETLSGLASLEGLFGDDEDDKPSGRANIELERAAANAILPTTVEIEVEIQENAREVQGSWALVKQIIGGDETANCMVAALNKMFSQQAGFQAVVTRGKASVPAPQDGATMSFNIKLSVVGQSFDMAMEMYFWPYANAEARVMFSGPGGALNAAMVGDVLTKVNDRLVAAEKSN
jgi:hypothetical protein